MDCPKQLSTKVLLKDSPLSYCHKRDHASKELQSPIIFGLKDIMANPERGFAELAITSFEHRRNRQRIENPLFLCEDFFDLTDISSLEGGRLRLLSLRKEPTYEIEFSSLSDEIFRKYNETPLILPALPIVDRRYNSSLEHQTTRNLFGKIEPQLTDAAIDDKQAHRMRDLFGYADIKMANINFDAEFKQRAYREID
uniref:Uncharacterized protein n=1 Tax=Glossina austeni TaxID=7395 RepID=A0A1A9UM49_GLOAU